MSLKITNATGFIIGEVLNTSTTEIYVRCNIEMTHQKLINDDVISIKTIPKTTLLGGKFDKTIQADGVSPIYWASYSTTSNDMNVLYLEIEQDIKAKLEEANPTWVIEIVSIPTVQN